MLVCGRCKDESICKISKYKNLFTKLDHPVSTSNVDDAFIMLSKTNGEGVVFSDTEYRNYPNKVVVIYKQIKQIWADKQNKKLGQAKNSGA